MPKKEGEAAEAIGRLRGGRAGNIHSVANVEGKPLVVMLISDSLADISVAARLLDDIAPPRHVLAGKAYEALLQT